MQGQLVYSSLQDRSDGCLETRLYIGKVLENSFRWYTVVAENNIGMTRTRVRLTQGTSCVDAFSMAYLWLTYCNVTRCNGTRPMSKNNLTKIYTDYVHFKLRLLIPVLSAFQSNLRSCLYQNLSRRILNIIVESTSEATLLGRVFHAAIIILLKRALVNCDECVLIGS